MIGIAEIKLTDAEIDAAVAVLKSGALRQGPQCQAFEGEFAAAVGAKHAMTSSNGSAALHLPYMALLEPGDEVLCPSFTFIATASMVSMAGGTPVFVDVDADTFLIDLEDAARKTTSKTKAIAPVHLFGNPCDRTAVEAFARDRGLKIVWDAAQAHGAAFEGVDVGGWDDVVSYSFYPSKNMFVGEGGMTTTNDPELDHKMRLLRSHGVAGKYNHVVLGLNYRMTDVEAAIGREQLKRLDAMLAVRRANADVLNAGLGQVPGVKPQQTTPGGAHAWHQYCILVDEDEFGCGRDELGERLKARGVASGVHYPRGLHQQPAYIDLIGEQTLPVTEKLAETILAIPVHHGMGTAEAQQVVDAVVDSRKG